jgi:hypothetical protein
MTTINPRTMRETYDRFFAQYAGAIEQDGQVDALMRGAFAAGVQHALLFASNLDPAQIAAGLDRMTHEIEDLWEKRT